MNRGYRTMTMTKLMIVEDCMGLTKYILIVGLKFCIKGLEKRIREDEAIATAITMLRGSRTKKREPILI